MSRTIVLATALSALIGAGVFAADPANAARCSRAAQQSAKDPHVPGATGRTIVPGDSSTIADDAKATRMQQTGAYTDD